MQAASDNFAQAITGSSGVWAPPQVLADWVGDGNNIVNTPDIRDYFNRSTSGGWGRADSGHIWTPLISPASDYFVSGGTATISMSTINSRIITVGGMITDFDVKFRASTNQLATGQAQRASVIGRVLNSNTFYLLRCDFNVDQVIGYGMERYFNGVETTFSSGLVPGITHAVGRKFWVRGQGVGTVFRMKIWQDGTPEPTAWTGTAVDGGITSPGQVGFRASTVTGNTNTAPLVYTVDSFTNGSWGDLTNQSGSLSVHQAMDDGLPSDITYTSGSDSTSSASVNVGDRAGLSAAQYWSEDTVTSPVAGYERDIPDMAISAGPVTARGVERVTLFTGQMSDAPVQGFTASIDAVSATRLKLTSNVQAPPIQGDAEGLTGTWPVSWALAKCGVYASPPPRGGCVWWAPAHGSMRPFLSNSPLNLEVRGATDVDFGRAPISIGVRPTFVTGPFVQGVFAEAAAVRTLVVGWQSMEFQYGSQLFSKAGNVGRVEFWVRTDPVNLVNGPSDNLVVFWIQDPSPSTVRFQCGVDIDFKPFFTINDGSNITSFGSPALPQDGQWHFVGLAWDIGGNLLRWQVDGTPFVANPTPAMTTANMAAVDNHDVTYPTFSSYLPISEIQITSGADAVPENSPWINDGSYFTPGAVIRPSILDLVALFETQPTEAAAFISNYAQAELAMTRTDELDRFCYLPMPYWVEADQQTVAETLSTGTNVGTDWSVSRDLTKIRNQVVVNYTGATVSNPLSTAPQDIALIFTVYTLSPGTTTITLPLTYPTLDITFLRDTFTLVTSTMVSSGEYPAAENLISANTKNDGTGTLATLGQIVATVASWDAGKATISVVNTTTTTYYTANSGVVPYIAVRGTYVVAADASVTVQDDANVALRGVRGLNVGLPAIQDADTATAIAGELLARAKTAKKQLTVTVRGDPRRQPGDLVRFTDPGGTNTNAVWRVLSVDHNIDGATYTQDLTLVEAALIGVWNESSWDDGSVWGP